MEGYLILMVVFLIIIAMFLSYRLDKVENKLKKLEFHQDIDSDAIDTLYEEVFCDCGYDEFLEDFKSPIKSIDEILGKKPNKTKAKKPLTKVSK